MFTEILVVLMFELLMRDVTAPFSPRSAHQPDTLIEECCLAQAAAGIAEASSLEWRQQHLGARPARLTEPIEDSQEEACLKVGIALLCVHTAIFSTALATR